MIKNLYVVRKSSLFIFFFYFLLPMQSASAALVKYSISGVLVFGLGDDAEETLEITGTAFIDDNNTFLGNPDCVTGYNSICNPTYSITYFDMSVGDQYSFTGNGSITYATADFRGSLYGTGDWSEMRHSRNDNTGDFASYEDWLAFELPSDISFEMGYQCCNGSIEVSNPDLLDVPHYIGVTLTAVPIPAAAWLFGSGLIGLIGFARRKKAA